MNAAEQWRPIPGTAGAYEASDLGRIRRVDSGRIRKGSPNTKGYLNIRLTENGAMVTRTVHRLVLTAFVGPRQPGTEANHKNADKTDNRLANLEYISHQDNLQHAWALGLKGYPDRCGVCNAVGHATADCDHPAAVSP